MQSTKTMKAVGYSTQVKPKASPPAKTPSFSWWPDGSGLLKSFRRRWFLVLSMGLLAATAAAITGWSLIPSKYTAFAQLQVRSQTPYLLPPNNSEGRAEFISYQRTQAALIKSRFVLSAALRMPGIGKLACVQRQLDPIAWLEEELKVDYQEGSEVMRLSLTGENPNEVATLVNAVKDAYLQEVINKEGERRAKRYSELEIAYNKLDTSIRSKKSDLDKLSETVGASDAASSSARQQLLLSQHNEFQKEHSRIEAEIRRATLLETSYKNRLQTLEAQKIPETEIEEYLSRDPSVQDQLARVSKAQAKVDRFAQLVVNDDDPALVRAKRDLKAVEEALDKQKQRLRQNYLTTVRDKGRQEIQANLADLASQLVVLSQQEASVRVKLEQYAMDAAKVGGSTSELEFLRGEIKQLTKVATNLADERDAVGVELNSEARVRELAAADVPQQMEFKKRLFLSAAASLAAFGLVALGICWLEFLGQRVDQPTEIVEHLGIPVVGSLPVLPYRKGRQLRNGSTMSAPEDNKFYNSIDEIRTLLLREVADHSLRIVMVSSAVAGEGKTTLASQLAASLAKAGQKTLLIDYDLEQPSLHELFEVPLEPGVADVVRDDVYLNDAIMSSSVEGLWLLPAGQVDERGSTALAQGRINQVLQTLRSEFQVIVIDSCPILDSIYAHLICQQVDGVILSVLRNSSRMHHVSAACDRLNMLGANLLGAVFGGERRKAVAAR